MSEEQWWPAQEGDGPHPYPMFHAARRFLWNGWYPIPVARETKQPTLGNWPEACKNLTYEGVEALWDNRDDPPNIGLVTGIRYDVLDIDGREGLASLEAHLAGRYFKPEGPMAVTGRGGRHLYFRSTGHGNRGHMLPNVDYRGFHGHVVAPPSIHANGNTYRWADGYSWDERELPDAPRWLLSLLEATKREESDTHADDRVSRDYGSVSAALDAEGIPFRHEGSLYVFSCQTGRHSDSDWSAKTGLGVMADRKWMCFGCGAWGDAENIRGGNHVHNGKPYQNQTLLPTT